MGRTIDAATYEFYQQQAPHYSLNPTLGPSRHLDGFLARLPQGAAILELGCGGGRDSALMAKRGFKLDATDGIPAMVAKASERPLVEARLMQFDELRAENAYYAVWAHACLLHCPRAELPDVVGAIWRALCADGLHYASFKLGDGEGRDLLGRLHNFPDANWLRNLYQQARFDIVEEEIFAGKASDGTQRDWLALTVRKK